MDGVLDMQSIFESATCTRKGLCPVSQIRKKDDPIESHSLYFEIHGSGPEKILFIMGLNSSSLSWSEQVAYFGKQTDLYSFLVFDNRGVGNSTSPRGPYTTSGMAEDIILLLNHVGWTKERNLHVVGLSLGGMIAQELAFRVPQWIVSLTLGVTTAGGMPWNNFPPWKGLTSLTRLTFIPDPNVKVPIILDMVFTQKWLDSKANDDASGRTNREVETELYLKRMSMTKPQTLMGSLSQMCAGLTHNVSPFRLAQLSSKIPKVLIITGDLDHLVRPQNSFYLKKHMPEAEFAVWENTGHAIHFQRKREFNAMLERVFQEGRKQVNEGPDTNR